eukprot:475691-Amorphochlora_amoeboformis.AAC.1
METGTGVRGPQALRLTSVVAAVLLGGVFLWGIVFGEGSEKERRDGEQVSDEADDEYLGKPKTVAEFRPPQVNPDFLITGLDLVQYPHDVEVRMCDDTGLGMVESCRDPVSPLFSNRMWLTPTH